MSATQDIQVQKKREVERETTVPVRVFVPTTDIHESQDSLVLHLEMPGVDKKRVSIRVEEGLLHIEGQLDFERYEGLRPIYTDTMLGITREIFDCLARLK
jgi:HSP20 family protein